MFMKWRENTASACVLVLGVPVSVTWLPYKDISPLNTEKDRTMSYFFSLGNYIRRFMVEKACLAQNHSTKPPTTHCQPSSQPDTGPFAALTSAG